MCSLEPFKIDLKRLTEDDTSFGFNLDDNYFRAIEATEVTKGNVRVTLSVHRTAERYFELNFHISGEVTVQCDRCLDDMPQDIDAEYGLVAKFGEEYSEDGDSVTVAEDDGVLDTAWFVYEFIVLSIPVRHVHEDGRCNSGMIRMLEEHGAARSTGGAGGETPIDPRWSGLLKLKN